MRRLLAIVVLLIGSVIAADNAAVIATPPDPGTVRDPASAIERVEDQIVREGAMGRTAVESRLEQSFSLDAVATISDPLGDAYWLRGDIRAAGTSSFTDGTIRVGLVTELVESPFSLSWEVGVTGAQWEIDVDLDGDVDRIVFFLNVDGLLYGTVTDAAINIVCYGDPWFDVDGGYFVDFDTSCIGDPPLYRWRSIMLFEDVPTFTSSYDAAPDVGWAAPVANDAHTTPAPPSTTPPATPPPPTPSCPTPSTTTIGGTDGAFTAVRPVRLFDTRPSECQGAIPISKARVGGTTILRVKAAGVMGVPSSGAGAVSMNVTAIGPSADGFVTVYPCGERPLAANLNYVTGQIVPNAVIAPLSPNGEICFFSSADTDLVADLNGWFATGEGFNPVTPTRVLDTRSAARVPAGGEYRMNVLGHSGLPGSGLGAVSMNVTAVSPTTSGFVTVYPCGSRPLTANLNFAAGQVVPNAVIAPVSDQGDVCFFTSSDIDLVADINGWFAQPGGFTPVSPTRVFDTRPSEPHGVSVVSKSRVPAGGVLEVRVLGVGGVPPSSVAAVALNVTAVAPSTDGFITVYPCGQRPLAANLNFVTGQVVPNAVIAPVSIAGNVCFFSMSEVDIVADISGYFG